MTTPTTNVRPDPLGVVTEFRDGLTPNRRPLAICAGRGGNPWFTEPGTPGRIARISTGADS